MQTGQRLNNEMPHFILLIPPVAPVDGAAHYYWVLLKWLHEFKGKETTVFVPAHYLNASTDTSRWENSEWSQRFHEYQAIDPKSADARFVCYDDHLTNWLSDQAPLDRFISYVTRDQPELYRYFLERFTRLKARYSDVVAVTWLNCPSMRRAAKEAGCQLIFNEIGPLRKPYYTQTAYWDISGVNGDTEVNSRWSREKEAFREWLNSLDHDVVDKMLESAMISEIAHDSYHSSSPNNAVGIALQVETDSNALAFSNGWNNLSLLEFANGACTDQPPLVRFHPNGKALYAGLVDLGQSPLRFLGSVKELWTINSSLGIEAVLWHKNVRFFGNTPVRMYFDESIDGARWFRIWFFLAYLIPYSLLFSAEYYIWRLSRPSVTEIAETHLRFLNKQRNDAEPDGSVLPVEVSTAMIVHSPNDVVRELFDLRQRCSTQDAFIANMKAQIEQMKNSISEKDVCISEQEAWIRKRDELIEERDARIRLLQPFEQQVHAFEERCARLDEHIAIETSLRLEAESETATLRTKLADLQLHYDKLHHAMKTLTEHLESKLMTFRWSTHRIMAKLKKTEQ
ncbi:GT99 family glycosyltransferase N-terminal domain-containing protein [Burkholderia multivorans]|uniref:GT99 family glycosyltransferase N-terminal domain-containing protein n=1 Tax=Burkholderia multivorans TaxID=87883 RepID=UPI0011B26B7A|nr:hypothetical protein [Burkholderia multivorans]